MAQDRRIKKIIKKIAKEENLSEGVVEITALIQFLFAKKVIESGEFKTVRLRYLGKFTPSQARLKWRAKRLAENKIKEDE